MEESDRKTRHADQEELVSVARVARTRGLRAEVIADLLTDFPERFDDLETLIAVAPDGGQRSLQIEEHWFQGRRIVFKFTGYDSIEAAKEFAGFELAVPASDRVELAEDQFYEWGVDGGRAYANDGAGVGRR